MSAASGPYAAEASASSPSTDRAVTAPTRSDSCSVARSGLPKSNSCRFTNADAVHARCQQPACSGAVQKSRPSRLTSAQLASELRRRPWPSSLTWVYSTPRGARARIRRTGTRSGGIADARFEQPFDEPLGPVIIADPPHVVTLSVVPMMSRLASSRHPLCRLGTRSASRQSGAGRWSQSDSRS